MTLRSTMHSFTTNTLISHSCSSALKRSWTPSGRPISAPVRSKNVWEISAVLDPETSSILVAGGGGVAMKTVQRLKQMSCNVAVLQRSSTRQKQIESMDCKFVKADVLSPEEIQSAFNGLEIDAVISSIGGSPANTEPDSEGNINLINEAAKKGVQKFILVTSIGAGDSRGAPPNQVYEALETQLQAKEKAEAHLKTSHGQMKYVIVRPGGLKNDTASGTAVLTEDNNVCGAIQREDVAELLVQCLFSSKTSNLVLSAVDKNMLFLNPEFEVFRP